MMSAAEQSTAATFADISKSIHGSAMVRHLPVALAECDLMELCNMILGVDVSNSTELDDSGWCLDPGSDVIASPVEARAVRAGRTS